MGDREGGDWVRRGRIGDQPEVALRNQERRVERDQEWKFIERESWGLGFGGERHSRLKLQTILFHISLFLCLSVDCCVRR